MSNPTQFKPLVDIVMLQANHTAVETVQMALEIEREKRKGNYNPVFSLTILWKF